MSLFLPIIEDVNKSLGSIAIDLNVDLFGVDCDIYDPVEEGAYTDIYGNRDGDFVKDQSRKAKVLFTGSLYDFFVSSDIDIGFLTDTNVYVKSDEVLYNGSKITVTKTNGITFNFRVQNIKSIGIINNVINKYTVIYIEE